MQDPTIVLKHIINDTIDLYRLATKDNIATISEELLKYGKEIKRNTESLIDMAWYRVDADEWRKKHPSGARTKL